MADVGAEVAGAAEADLRVHVGAVHVDLAAVLVHDVADAADLLLEHAVRRGIGDHQRGQIFGVLGGAPLEIGDVDVAVLVGLDDDDLVVDHGGRRGVRAVRRVPRRAPRGRP